MEKIKIKDFTGNILCGNCGESNDGGMILKGYEGEIDEERKRIILKPFSTVCLHCDVLFSEFIFDNPIDMSFLE